MSKYKLDGIDVWFGTPDAPAPSGVITAEKIEITVGVSAKAQGAVVTVHYQRAGGPWQKLLLRLKQSTAEAHYFSGHFPAFPPRSRVEYKLHVRLGGSRPRPDRQVGDMHSFEIAPELDQKSPSPAPQVTPNAPSSTSESPSEDAVASPKKDAETGSTMKVARLARLPVNTARKLASATPARALLNNETVSSLISEGKMKPNDADRLKIANIALDLAKDNEEVAGKMISVLEGRGVTKPQDLAGVSREELINALENAGVANREEAASQAANLRSAVGRAFPTETLSPSRVPIADSSANSESINKAWQNNAGLDLLRMDLSKDSVDRKKLNLAGLTRFERKAFIRDLQTRKGAITATGNADIAEKLFRKGITSPATVSPVRLAKEAGISLDRAKNIHKRDIQRYGRLSQGLLTLMDAHSGGLQNLAVGNIRRDKVVGIVRRAETDETFDGLDNLQELFGNLDSCNCKHCNSVLGPAAYFVDLMHFVQTHVLDEELNEGDVIEEEDPPFKGKQNHRLHLKKRRPDLWVLPLTCENTHTEIPQLQITNEIFENFIAQKHGVEVTLDDRSAVLAEVYGNRLPEGRHSILQPFNLPMEELEIYLGHFKLQRSDIVRLLDQPEDVQLRAALGISQVHADLITIPDASSTNIHNKLGLTLTDDCEFKEDGMQKGGMPIRDILEATGLNREELGDLLQTHFVGGESPPSIVPRKTGEKSVQFDGEFVCKLRLDHLDRAHRLLRLRRFIPWSPKELDGFIASVGGSLNNATLADAGRAMILKRRFKALPHELCALAGEMPGFSMERKKTLEATERNPYDLLFNVPDLMREESSYPEPTIRYNANETSSAAQERTMRLRAGLRLDEGDLTALIEGLAGAFTDGTSPNTAATQTRFFGLRLRRLPRPTLPALATPIYPRPLPIIGVKQGAFSLNKHNLSLLVRQTVLARWLKLSITDFLTLVRLTPDVGNHVATLRDVLAVVHFYDWWKKTPLSLEDLSLLLAPVSALTEQVEDLWKALQTWLQEQDEIALTDTFLTQIEGVNEELSRELIALNMETVFETSDGRFHVIASSNTDSLDLIPIQGKDIDEEAIRQLVQEHHPNERLPHALAEALQMDIDLARSVVAAALASNEKLSLGDFLQEGDLPAPLRPVAIAILRLHCVGSGLKLAPTTLSFVANHQTAFGIADWVNPNPMVLRRIAATQALLKKNFRNDPSPALLQLERLFADSIALPESAITLLELEPVLAQDLATTLPLPENLVDALFKLESYAEMANKLSVDAITLLRIANEQYAIANIASAAVIAGFRAKYTDEEVWKEKVEPYQERLLEKKRDALIDYLLHGPDAEFSDTREMYKYFLIDGEVDGCFRTSRVVAASSSLQLYVHRIRMNLEKEPKDGLHVKPSLIPSEEWEWRQHYRVWEANRKIFLWPENYLDPTIRDDKTPLFEELESELLQQEITEQTVIDAYSNYLKGLEELANLRYAGAYHHYIEDEETEKATDILYLFGATGGDAPTHYWREIRNLARSQNSEENMLISPEHGPWRKVETRIPTRYASPVVYDGQLHVFWNEITTTSQNAVNDGKSRFVGYSHRYTLKYTSLRLDGQWTPPESISLKGAAKTFEETDSSIDDPLVEAKEIEEFIEALFKPENFQLGFGIFANPGLIDHLEVDSGLLTPRYGTEDHTKAREGYTLDGFMWERPFLSVDPSYGHRLLAHCAGLLVRGAVDLFDRQVIPTSDTEHIFSPSAEACLFAIAMRQKMIYRPPATYYDMLAPNLSILRRDDGILSHVTWNNCPFDYPVAASLALNAQDLGVFKRHWSNNAGGNPFYFNNLPEPGPEIADIPSDAGVWAVEGTPNECVIETEDEMFLLQPSVTVDGHYVLHRLGTTLVRGVARKLFTDGIDGLLAIEHQLGLSEPEPEVSGPRTHNQTVQNPIANDAAYSIYYQEVFQHIPLLIAHYLNAQGKFEHAQRWYHYVFDPTSPEPSTDEEAPETDRNWKYRQFRGQEQTKLRDTLSDTAAIQKYRKDPFNVHAIARLRVSAYQKAVVMRYIDNLLDWGDEQFTRFQMETVNKAMMLYVIAAEVLGPRPIRLGECGELSDSTRTYNKLKDSISEDGEFLLEVEELIPRPQTGVPSDAGNPRLTPAFGLKGLLAFPISEASIANTTTGATATVAGQAVPTNAGAAHGILVSTGVSESEGPSSTAALPASAAQGVIGAMRSGGTVGGAGNPATSPTMTIGATHQVSASTTESAYAMESVAFAKVASVQPRTEALVKSFALRQQFQFLGGHWKANGGHQVPSTLGDRFSRAVIRQVCAAFCFPRNEILEDYWNRVEDRIQKIRTCRDITGRRRKLSLFAPPIDPALLARARAAGIALDDVLNAFDGMIPLYRFPYLLQKAKEFAGTVQSFGSALQSALERKDSEELIRLQTTQQQQMLALTTKAKEWEMESAQANLEATLRRKTAVENRQVHYIGLLDEGLNNWEVAEAIGTHTASIILGSAAASNFISAVFGLVPQLGSPFAMKYGGHELKEGPGRIAIALGQLADLARNVATSSALEGRNARRREDWEFQRDQSNDELSQIEKQIEASEIARDLAEHAIKLHEKSIEHNDDLLEYHEDKFSALGLYAWLASQLQRTYREAYNMAYRMARYAEQAYRFEREDYTSELLSGQYWEPARAGLLAGNRLTLDLQHLDQRYIETDQQKHELIDHVFSLRQWNPEALINLRQSGECQFKVSELFFDISSPGDYRRRIRSVRVTIPAVTGPYTNIMAKLSLDSSEIRISPSAELLEAPRPRIDSITTSSARNDAGAFELNFRGEKYVPFEGAGAANSEWSLSLPSAVKMFDYKTISDVLLHFDYTASFDGVYRDVVQGISEGLVSSIQQRISNEGFTRVFNLNEEFAPEFARLVAGNTVELNIDRQHLPFFVQNASVSEATLKLIGTGDDSISISSVEFDDETIDEIESDEIGVRASLSMNSSLPWKHKIRLVDLIGNVSGIYLVMKLGLPS